MLHLLELKTISAFAARSMLINCFEVALQQGVTVSVAITDNAGHLVAFERGDGASLGSIAVSQSKARTAAFYRTPTRMLYERAKAGQLLLPLPDLIAAPGGIPLLSGPILIGAIGVSGATGDQDELIAQAGVLHAATLAP